MQLLRGHALFACLVPAVIGLWLRLSLVGGPPFTDGGTYQYNAWLAEREAGSLTTAPLNVYSWVAALFGQPVDTPFLRARVLDAVALAVAAAAFCWLLKRCRATWSVSAAIASIWAVLWSTPVFCDCGFKHPIVAACAPLFVSLGLLLSTKPRPIVCGVLVAFACLLREAFAPIAVLLPLIAWLRFGFKTGVLTVLGGAIGGAIGCAWMFAVGIRPVEALANLRAMTKNANGLLAALEIEPATIRADSFWRALDHVWPILFWPVVAMLSARWRRATRWRRRGPVLALLVLLLYPLVEIFGKFCLPYHWLQVAPAVLLFAALADRRLRVRARRRAHMQWLRIAVWQSFAVVAFFGSRPVRDQIAMGQSWHDSYAAVMQEGDWQHPATNANRYLQVARWLRDNSAADATLLVSGYGYALYPLADRRPASVQVSDLTFSRLTGQHEDHPEWIAALRETPPDFVLETDRWPEPLDSVWPDFGNRFEKVAEWGEEASVLYGNFGMRLWRRRQ